MIIEKETCEKCKTRSAVKRSVRISIEKLESMPGLVRCIQKVFKCPHCHTLRVFTIPLTAEEFEKMIKELS